MCLHAFTIRVIFVNGDTSNPIHEKNIINSANTKYTWYRLVTHYQIIKWYGLLSKLLKV